MRDVLYSLRQFQKSPGFTVLAILCLGLGIGVNASIFSVLNSLFFRPLPVANPDQVVVLSRSTGPLLSYLDFRDFRDRTVTLEGMAASNPYSHLFRTPSMPVQHRHEGPGSPRRRNLAS